MNKRNVAVLISGNGSNLQALMDAAAAPEYPANITLVISNKSEAYGLQRAQMAGVATHVLDHRAYETRELYDAALDEILRAHAIELVCLAGFMRLLTGEFVRRWHGRMINIHPSLLPKFKGAHAMKDALEAGETITGCTVHFVTEEMDAGPIILQEAVDINPGDTLETLAPRVHAAEHRLYPRALEMLASGSL